jgi:hypothetical protein
MITNKIFNSLIIYGNLINLSIIYIYYLYFYLIFTLCIFLNKLIDTFKIIIKYFLLYLKILIYKSIYPQILK